jgi:hypothetical protein
VVCLTDGLVHTTYREVPWPHLTLTTYRDMPFGRNVKLELS